MRNHPPCKGIDACRRCALFRDCVQFCSGLVDLVVCVRHHFGGGHRLTLAGERFVGLVAEDIAQVGDRGAEFRGPATAVRGLSAKPAMMAAASWRPSRSRNTARTARGVRIMAVLPAVVVVADRQSEVIERGQRVAVFGLEAGQDARQVGLDEAVAAVLGDRQAPAQGLQRADGIGVAEGEAVGEQRERERTRVAAWPRRPRSGHPRRPSPPHRNPRPPARTPGMPW